MKTLRKRFANGLIVGFRRGEWWIGARKSFTMYALEFNLFGLTLIVPYELAKDARVRLRDWPKWRRHGHPRTALIGFAVTFLTCYGYWSWAEAAYMWQQYADPLWPCLFVACLGAQAALIVHMLTDIAIGTFRLLARRRRNR